MFIIQILCWETSLARLAGSRAAWPAVLDGRLVRQCTAYARARASPRSIYAWSQVWRDVVKAWLQALSQIDINSASFWDVPQSVQVLLENLRKPLKRKKENLWKPLETFENHWKPLKASENLWKHLKIEKTLHGKTIFDGKRKTSETAFCWLCRSLHTFAVFRPADPIIPCDH